MFKNHPKGLIGAALSNMGERFGFYIMMAILTLFISSKFGLATKPTGYIYGVFYASIYILALVGGLIADKTRNYKGTILFGIILMAVGYLIIAIPTPTPVPNMALYLVITCLGLSVIAFGNGLFKGNLQALVGQMYDNPKYEKMRDSGFQIFYMFINIGGFFAPWIAVGVRNWWLKANGFDYNATLPELCHEFIEKGSGITAVNLSKLQEYAQAATLNGSVSDLSSFCNQYLDVFNRGFQYAFMAAIVAMFISLLIFIINKAKFPDPAGAGKKKASVATIDKSEITMSANEIRQRIYALFAVFGVVIFFWFSFHQNGYSLTYFAKDYINLNIINLDLGFTAIKGAEIFQCINPFFVVFLTPIVMWYFGLLRKKGKEPSTPRKIGLGMGIAALGYVFMLLVSIALPDTATLPDMSADALDAMRLTPWVMVGLYFILTVAELFISPLGLSFVSKVAPPHLQGLMQGCWLAATAIGNLLVIIGGLLYNSVPLWMCWLVFVCACGLSMILMLAMVKWLERVAK
ncbi:MAG: peptide MFS transporter [Tannerella sp.]|jgi:POT family proton-dependent oligopeptide transporter|nr:peptide MFS transporter [Tannerella sp.]